MDDRSLFHFRHTIEVRYSDVDAQGIVNHARYLTYMEMARFKFMERLDLFRPGMSFEDVGLIIADVQCSYKVPLKFPGDVQVYLRTAAIGKKSFTFHYRVETAPDTLHAMARSVQVAYDYRGLRSIHVPDEWRARLQAFEEGA
jgi:acyl-CoA thioester hydrolase